MKQILATMGLDPADLANTAQLPKIRRARDYHCYDQSNQRYLDLCRADGASLLGYSLPGFKLAIKNRISQALWQGLPHPIHRQLQKELMSLFPGHLAIVCPNQSLLQRVLELIGRSTSRPYIPLLSDFTHNAQPGGLGIWLPFLQAPAELAIAFLPRPGSDGPFILLIDKEIAKTISDITLPETLVFFDYISQQTPVYCAQALLQGMSALKSLGAFGATPRKDTTQSLGVWSEELWGTINTGIWQRQGPYLTHGFSPKQYALVFKHALTQGIILNPRSAGINILPGIISLGEQKALEGLLAFQP